MIQFALGPSDFSCSDITEEELAGRASRGVKIVYNFPWGQEALETLLSRGDAELMQTHNSARNKLQVIVMLPSTAGSKLQLIPYPSYAVTIKQLRSRS